MVPEVEMDALEEAPLDAWSMLHGTATSLLPLVVTDDPELDVAELELVSELVLIDELSCTTANSTLPDWGLISTSLMLPMDEPDEPWICAP